MSHSIKRLYDHEIVGNEMAITSSERYLSFTAFNPQNIGELVHRGFAQGCVLSIAHNYYLLRTFVAFDFFSDGGLHSSSSVVRP